MAKGLIAYIYKSEGRSFSNGGISFRCNEVTVLGCPNGEIFDVTDEAPAVKFVRRMIGGKEYVHLEPVDAPPGKLPMFGGCYVSTSDSRFREAHGVFGAIPLFDRYE